MKKLVLITLGLVLSFDLFPQKLIMTLDTTKEMNWPVNTPLIEAFDSNLVEYGKGYSGHTTYIFDLKEKKLTMIDVNNLSVESKILKFEENNVGYYIEILNNIYTTKFIITKKDDYNSALFCIFDFEEGDTRTEGFYSNKVEINYNGYN